MKSCKLLLAKYRFVNIVLFFLEFISELFDKNSIWIDWPILVAVIIPGPKTLSRKITCLFADVFP